MEDFTKLKIAALAAPALAELNRGFKTNRDKFKSLKTKFRKVDRWWDSLDWKNKVDVGNAAVHFHKMTPNYCWDCYETKFADLKKSQRKIIEFVFSKRYEPYSFFYLPGLLKL